MDEKPSTSYRKYANEKAWRKPFDKQKKENSIPLVKIAVEDWIELRDLYKQDWPEHIISYNSLNNYIDWVQQDNEMAKHIIIKALDDGGFWREHGTYLIEDRNDLRFNVLFNTLQLDRPHLLRTLLKALSEETHYMLSAFPERLMPIVKEFMDELGLLECSKNTLLENLLYRLPCADCVGINIPNPVNGYTIAPLSLDLLPRISSLWPQHFRGENYFLNRAVRYNLTYGTFFSKTDDLVALVLQLPIGTIGYMQLEEIFKQASISEHMVAVLAQKIGEKGLDSTATILPSNKASRTIFEKLGFKVIGRIYWFDTMPKDNDDDDSSDDSSASNIAFRI